MVGHAVPSLRRIHRSSAESEALVHATGAGVRLPDIEHDGRRATAKGVRDDRGGNAASEPSPPRVAAGVDVADRADTKGRCHEVGSRDRDQTAVFADAPKRPLLEHAGEEEIRRLVTPGAVAIQAGDLVEVGAG